MNDSIFMFNDFKLLLKNLQNAIKQKQSYSLLLGESGTGKTTILKTLSKSLDKSKYQLLYISHGQPTPSTFIRLLAGHFHLPVRNSRAETSKLILQTIRHLPQYLLIFFDEAHYLSDETFIEIRLLAEAELDQPSLFSVIFSALPSLKNRLLTPNLFPLWRRMITKNNLRGLIIEEVKSFLEFSFSKKTIDKISNEARNLIFEQSFGTPALLNLYTQQLLNKFPNTNITKEHVLEIIDNNETL